MSGKIPIGRTHARLAATAAKSRAGHAACGIVMWLAATAILSGLSAATAAAQYTVLGGRASSGIPDEEALRENIEEARWSSGPFRFQPWLGLRDLSYVRSQQSVSGDAAQSDQQLTVTVGAGLRAYAPVGSRTVWAAHLLPEYVWWQDDDSKGGLNGRYGMGLFGYANRLEFQLSHRLVETQSFFSDEVQELTTSSTATTEVGVEVQVLRGLHLYGSWDRTDFEGDADDAAAFALLDRVEDGWSAGVRLRSHRGWSMGLGVRQTEGDFDAGARNFSFESEAVTLDLSASVRKFDISLEIEDAEVTPQAGSQLEPFQATFGTLDIGFQPRSRLGFEFYAQRRRSFSIVESRSLIIGEEQGVRILLGLGSWDVRLLAGVGSLETEGLGGAADQSDDYDLLGASLGFTAGRLGTLRLNFIHRSYDRGILFGDRDVTSFGLSVQLGALTKRLSVGKVRSEW